MSNNPSFTMDPEIKAKWVRALRSGEYKQTNRFLQCDGGNCCLGVLARLEEIPSRKAAYGGADLVDFDFDGTNTFQYTSFPPEGFMGMSGVVMYNLASMNDGVGLHRKHSFKEIADYIEENF